MAIYTVANLYDLFLVSSDLTGTYTQTSDIDMLPMHPDHVEQWTAKNYTKGDVVKDTIAEVEYTFICKLSTSNNESVTNGSFWSLLCTTSQGWIPIGNGTDKFTGTYNGQNFTIRNLYINRGATDYVGLFGYTTSVIQNLCLDTMTVTGNLNVGGLTGYSSGALSNCHVKTGTITGNNHYVGGVTGRLNTTTMIYCSNENANVVGIRPSNYCGGLVGGCLSTAAIGRSYNNSIVTCANYAGGISGITTSSSILDCYNLGAITIGTIGNYFGGITGYAYTNATVTNCYSTGLISGNAVATYQGGAIGRKDASATITNCFYNSQTSGQSDTGKGDGKTTGELKQWVSPLTGFDFTTSKIWRMGPSYNSGYPFLGGITPYEEYSRRDRINTYRSRYHILEG